MNVKFGHFAVLDAHHSVHEVLRQSVIAEKNGFDSVFVSDHFHPWLNTRAQAAMGWPVIAAIAERTKEVAPISTNCTCPIIRYNPAIVAQTFATLSVMYPNRIALGVGAGEPVNEVPMTGSWPNPGKRLDMLVEAVKVVKMLWENENPNTFKGRYFRLLKAKLYTKPKEKIPLYFAATGPKACELAGRYGDHWITCHADADKLRNLTIPAFERGAKEAGKNPDEMDRVLTSGYALNSSLKKAVYACRAYAGGQVPGALKYRMYDPREIEKYASDISDEALMRNFIVATSADEIIERLDEYVKAGINHFCLIDLGPDIDQSMDVMGKKVIPYFKSKA